MFHLSFSRAFHFKTNYNLICLVEIAQIRVRLSFPSVPHFIFHWLHWSLIKYGCKYEWLSRFSAPREVERRKTLWKWSIIRGKKVPMQILCRLTGHAILLLMMPKALWHRIDFTYLSTQFISMVVKRQDREWVDRGYTGKYQDVVGWDGERWGDLRKCSRSWYIWGCRFKYTINMGCVGWGNYPSLCGEGALIK